MKCRQARDLLELYGSGELSVKEQRELEKHLSGCASCAKVRAGALAFSQRIAGLASAQPVLADGQAMVRAVMRSLDRPEVEAAIKRGCIAILAMAAPGSARMIPVGDDLVPAGASGSTPHEGEQH